MYVCIHVYVFTLIRYCPISYVLVISTFTVFIGVSVSAYTWLCACLMLLGGKNGAKVQSFESY